MATPTMEQIKKKMQAMKQEKENVTDLADQAEEKTFKSGNQGCRLVLMVAAFHDRDIKVFDNLIYVESAAWKAARAAAAKEGAAATAAVEAVAPAETKKKSAKA